MMKVLMSQTLSGSQTAMMLRLPEGTHTHTREHAYTQPPTCTGLTAGMPLLFD